MANVEPVAPVIDFEALLKPISDDNPSGMSIRYENIYKEISDARKSDDPNLAQGDWKTDIKIADYRKVIDLTVPVIASQSKDLQLCVWLSEALTHQQGFAGLRDSLKLICEIEENFWETMFPEIDEGDMEARANAIEWLDTQLSIVVKTLPITSSRFSYLDWDESTRFDFPDNFENLDYESREKFTALKLQAEQENRKTADMWRAAKAQTNRAFCETLNLTLEEAWNELNRLDTVNGEKFDRNQVPSVRNSKKSLEDIRFQVNKLLEEKREAEPDEAQPEEVAVETVNESGETVVTTRGPAVPTGAIQSRQDALKRLSDVADYFKKNEPHSPISYIIQRAVKWGNMPLETWLQDVIKDESIIFQIRQTLGFNTNTGDSTESQ